MTIVDSATTDLPTSGGLDMIIPLNTHLNLDRATGGGALRSIGEKFVDFRSLENASAGHANALDGVSQDDGAKWAHLDPIAERIGALDGGCQRSAAETWPRMSAMLGLTTWRPRAGSCASPARWPRE